MRVGLAGLVLAAGGGRRFGGAKALARTPDGETWLGRAVALLSRAGCERVVVVLGAEAEAARALVPAGTEVVTAEDWAEGLGASLAAGVAALPDADAVLITLVDLPGMPDSVPARILAAGQGRSDLVRATYAAAPGHPVLLGRDHWDGFRDSLHGDHGGRAYLEAHGVTHLECGDLFSGEDVDTR